MIKPISTTSLPCNQLFSNFNFLNDSWILSFCWQTQLTQTSFSSSRCSVKINQGEYICKMWMKQQTYTILSMFVIQCSILTQHANMFNIWWVRPVFSLASWIPCLIQNYYLVPSSSEKEHNNYVKTTVRLMTECHQPYTYIPPQLSENSIKGKIDGGPAWVCVGLY